MAQGMTNNHITRIGGFDSNPNIYWHIRTNCDGGKHRRFKIAIIRIAGSKEWVLQIFPQSSEQIIDTSPA